MTRAETSSIKWFLMSIAGVVVVSALTQVGITIWWAGAISTKVSELENIVVRQDARITYLERLQINRGHLVPEGNG